MEVLVPPGLDWSSCPGYRAVGQQELPLLQKHGAVGRLRRQRKVTTVMLWTFFLFFNSFNPQKTNYHLFHDPQIFLHMHRKKAQLFGILCFPEKERLSLMK